MEKDGQGACNLCVCVCVLGRGIAWFTISGYDSCSAGAMQLSI